MRQPDLFKLPQKPWNAGRIIGPKAPLKPKHIWSIRQQLKTSRCVRQMVDLEPAAYVLVARRRAAFSCPESAPLRGPHPLVQR